MRDILSKQKVLFAGTSLDTRTPGVRANCSANILGGDAKIKGLGLGLILLLKLPIFLFLLLGKFLLFLKLAKVLKLLAVPFLLLALIPLLLGPLLLLAPLLLPLLLALPIPVITPAAPAAGRRRRDISFVQNLFESESCLERIGCVLATDKEPIYTYSMAWGLERLKPLIPHPKMAPYVNAFQASAEKKMSREDCYRKYTCNHEFFPKIKKTKKTA